MAFRTGSLVSTSLRPTIGTSGWWTTASSTSVGRSATTAARTKRRDRSEQKWHLCSYSLEDRKETVLGDVNSYQISFDGKKMLVKIDKDYSIIDLPKDKLETKDHKLELNGLDVIADRRAEWKQIYYEAWRQMRDFFFSPTMNGVDWKAMRDKYAALLPYVNHRNDLTYIIGELIGELNNGHAYVAGGERPETPRIKLGLLGAELSRDPTSKAYRIDRILPGENWEKDNRSPLTAIGVNVKPGDYILAVNGTPVSSLPNIYDALIGTADKQVILRVNSTPSDAGARDITVVPTADESPLYYLDWVQHNIDYVNKKTGGQVGYVHIPDMGQPGLNEFTKRYFPQIRKKGLIVDVRGNGGGFVSPLVIERLRRALVMVEMSRNGVPRTRSTADLPWSHGHIDQRVLRLRRRYLPLSLQDARPGKIDRQTHLGRSHWYSQPAAAA